MSWARDVWPSERARLMSGHMMPTEREVFEESRMVLELFRELNDMGGSMRCESEHADPRNRECSVEVTHRSDTSHKTKNTCANHAAYVEEAISTIGARCASCGQTCADHWSVRPI